MLCRRTKNIHLKSAVCKNGHLLTTTLLPEQTCIYTYCPQCGEEIIISCQHCGKNIPGGWGTITEIRDSFGERESQKLYPLSKEESIPNYCPYCGEPYPWTEKFLNDYKTLLNLYEDEIENKLSETIYSATENLLKDRFSTSSLNAVILKKCFNRLSDLTKLVFINAVSGFAGEALKNYFLSSVK